MTLKISLNSGNWFCFWLYLALLTLQGCSTQGGKPQTVETRYLPPATASKTSLVVPRSPYSSQGLKQLTNLRKQNPALNTFLNNNRKPDYFFSTPDNKIYCIYLGSNNLYTFKPGQSDGGPVRFHPLPAPIRKSLEQVKHYRITRHPQQPLEIPFSLQARRSLEASLKPGTRQNRNAAYIDKNIVQRLLAGDESAMNRLYYFDHSLIDSLENAYAAKYEARKQRLKMAFPQAYSPERLYSEKPEQAKKILFSKSANGTRTTSFVVPNFLPGSPYYRASYGTITPAFAALYFVHIAPQHAELKDLRWRYILRPCQADENERCTYQSGDSSEIRAIVIAATLYNRKTGKIIETITLK